MCFQPVNESPTTHLQFTFNALSEPGEMRESPHHESSGHSDGRNPEGLSPFELGVLQLPPFDDILYRMPLKLEDFGERRQNLLVM
jgi:hypothetical protein